MALQYIGLCMINFDVIQLPHLDGRLHGILSQHDRMLALMQHWMHNVTLINMNKIQWACFIIARILIFISIMILGGVLADEQIIQWSIFISFWFALLVSWVIPYFLWKIQGYKMLNIYGIMVSLVGCIILYIDHQILISRWFYAVGSMMPTVLIIAGIILIVVSNT